MATKAAYFDQVEAAAPATPATAVVRTYAKADGLMYSKDDAGVETLMSSGGYPPVSVDKVATGEATTSTTFTDLTTPGPAVTVTVPASGKVRVTVGVNAANNTANKYCAVGVALSGANTAAAVAVLTASAGAAAYQRRSVTTIMTGLTPGSTTFTSKYSVESNTGTFYNREIIVEPVD